MVNNLLLSTWLALSSPALASGGYDTNHMDVEWHTLETEHFLFHWPRSKRPIDDPHYFTTEFTVSTLSKIAEDTYTKICSQLNYYPKEKINVVIYDQDVGWEGNGFALAEYDWTGFSADWGPLFRMRGRLEFLSDVFVHEFAHIVSLKAYLPWSEAMTYMEFGGLTEDEEWLRRWGYKGQQSINFDVGFSGMLSVHTPFWWAEGGAEYWSHNAGTNFWGDSREAFLRTTFLENRQLDLHEWTTVADKNGFDGERGYNQGYDFGLYLQKRFEFDVMSKMAQISGENWHFSWDDVVQKATGLSTKELYNDWVVYNKQRFETTQSQVLSNGIVAGKELSLTELPWESTDPDVQKDWNSLPKIQQDEEMDGFTAYQELSRYSPNGEYVAWFESGLNIVKVAPEEWGAISGRYKSDEDKKYFNELKKNSYQNDWIRPYPMSWAPDSQSVLAIGFEDWDSDFKMNQGLQWNGDGYNWNQLMRGDLVQGKKGLTVQWHKIPNTIRAVEAVWKEDASQIAFVRYGDGTHNIWTIEPDGSNPKQHTQFSDGTQVQGLNWLKGTDTLIMGLFRDFKQEIWLFNLKTGEWTQLTDNNIDESDPFVAPDNKIWFTSNLNGMHNVFSLDEQGVVQQHTNVVGMAYGVDVTKEGHVFFTDCTGHGFRIKALAVDQRKNDVVEYPGVKPFADIIAKENMYKAPDISTVLPFSRRYKTWDGQMPFSLVPVLRSTDKNVEVGNYFSFGDVLEKHALEGMVTFGKDNYLYLTYWNSQFWPNLSLGYSRYTYKGDYGYGDDIDGNPDTNDLRIVDVKFEQLSEDIWLSASYIPSYALWMSLVADISRYSFRDYGDGANWDPYQVSYGIGTYIEWSPRGSVYSGDDWINPRGGRRVYLDYAHRWSTIVDPELAGGIYDNGEFLESYSYNRLQISWTEYIPVPKTEHHTLQLDFEVGYIDRNVMGWDEFMAGGRHPYNWGNGTIGNNIQFSGFEGYSLSGETMLIANGTYRFPLVRNIKKKFGPIYLDSMYLQFFGSIGNLWSYRIEGESHPEGYSVVASENGSVRRETPFMDYASKNSPINRPNYFLSDIGAELRTRSFIWNDWDWDGFLRISYGMQPTAGYGDVNADLIQSTLARDSVSELSAEVEEPTIRVYLGLGTGW